VVCSVSIGVASHPDDGNTMDAVVARADRAMYRAKQAGRNRVVQFEPSAA
jgi:diguanylate cyclase (GGDEF)-like protein